MEEVEEREGRTSPSSSLFWFSRLVSIVEALVVDLSVFMLNRRI